MRWVGQVTCVGKRTSAYRFFVGKPKGKKPLERPICIDESIILKWIFKKYDVGGGMDWIYLAQDWDR
jgi:hypothetical protein